MLLPFTSKLIFGLHTHEYESFYGIIQSGLNGLMTVLVYVNLSKKTKSSAIAEIARDVWNGHSRSLNVIRCCANRRGIHDQKLFKKRFRQDVRKNFSNRVIDNRNMLPVSCVNCSTVNTFQKHLSSELESEAVKCVSCGSRHNTAKACAYSCQHRLWRAGIGEFGEYFLLALNTSNLTSIFNRFWDVMPLYFTSLPGGTGKRWLEVGGRALVSGCPEHWTIQP